MNTEEHYVEALQQLMDIYVPAAFAKIAPPGIREGAEKGLIFVNSKDLLEFHQKLSKELSNAEDLEELAICFIRNSPKMLELYVKYARGKEKSAQIIEENR